MQQWWQDLIAGAGKWLPNILTALLILLGSIYLAKLLSKLVARGLKKRNADPEIALLLKQLTHWTIIGVGSITALQRFFDVTAFLAGLGILGFTIGFALQNIMQNFTAGVILLIQQPFNMGDAIEVGDYGGSVLAINLRTTEMRTWDGRIVIIPNADIVSNVIVNYTRANLRRIDVRVGVDYGADLEQARASILGALPAVPGYITEPAPSVFSDAFGDSSVNLTAYFWIDTARAGLFDAKDAAIRLIKDALEKQSIEIPFPIQTVYVKSED